MSPNYRVGLRASYGRDQQPGWDRRRIAPQLALGRRPARCGTTCGSTTRASTTSSACGSTSPSTATIVARARTRSPRQWRLGIGSRRQCSRCARALCSFMWSASDARTPREEVSGAAGRNASWQSRRRAASPRGSEEVSGVLRRPLQRRAGHGETGKHEWLAQGAISSSHSLLRLLCGIFRRPPPSCPPPFPFSPPGLCSRPAQHVCLNRRDGTLFTAARVPRDRTTRKRNSEHVLRTWTGAGLWGVGFELQVECIAAPRGVRELGRAQACRDGMETSGEARDTENPRTLRQTICWQRSKLGSARSAVTFGRRRARPFVTSARAGTLFACVRNPAQAVDNKHTHTHTPRLDVDAMGQWMLSHSASRESRDSSTSVAPMKFRRGLRWPRCPRLVAASGRRSLYGSRARWAGGSGVLIASAAVTAAHQSFPRAPQRRLELAITQRLGGSALKRCAGPANMGGRLCSSACRRRRHSHAAARGVGAAIGTGCRGCQGRRPPLARLLRAQSFGAFRRWVGG